MRLRHVDNDIFDDKSSHLDRYGLVLLLTIAAVVVQSLLETRNPSDQYETDLGGMIVSVFVGLTFLIALQASGIKRRWLNLATVLIGGGLTIMFAGWMVSLFSDTDTWESLGSGPPIIRSIFAVITPIAVIRRISSHTRVTASTLIGAISAYILIGLAFNYVFLAVDAVESTPFFGEIEPTTAYMYFSLVTMTTLGYGDLNPETDFGRLMATTEAVISQVFLVTFVAMLVGLWIANRGSVSREMADKQ